MAFYEERFPEEISRGSTGGPTRLTQTVTLRSGYEERNTPWAHPRHKYDAAVGVRSLANLDEVIQFWHAMHGMLHGFRWKDWADYSSNSGSTVTATDQTIGTADTAETEEFQLIKTYETIGASYVRTITKPVSGTVKVAVDDVEQLAGWTVDTTTGIITFSPALSPGEVVKAGYEFDVPVRFDTDELSISIEGFMAGAVPSIPIIEIRI